MKGKFKKLIAGAAVLAMAAQFAFVLPASAETIYTQDFTGVTNPTTVATATDTGALKMATDTDHGSYLSYDFTGSDANSRSMTVDFTADTTGKEKYVVEFDAALTAGNDQTTEFALSTSNRAFYNRTQNDGIESGYIFKMSTTKSDTWSIAGSDATAKLEPGKWYKYKAIVDTTQGYVSLSILDGGTPVLDKAIMGVNGAARDIKGFYVRAGRKASITNIDNIVVRDADDTTDTFGEIPAEKIYSLTFATESDEGTVLPAKVDPPAEDNGDDDYYIDLNAVGTLGHDVFARYSDKYTVDWKVIGLSSEDGYINITLDDDDTTNLTLEEGDTVEGSKATGAKVNIRDGVSNWFAQIQATVHFTDADGKEQTMSTSRTFVVLAAQENPTQIFPATGYPSDASAYIDDLTEYKSGMTAIDSRDNIFGWSIYGGNGNGYITLGKDAETEDKYFKFTTGAGGGSTNAEVNIGDITDEFVVDMVTRFTGATSWGYYSNTPNNSGISSAFTFDYSGGTLTSGTGSVSGLSDNTWYRIVVDCNRAVKKTSVIVLDENGAEKGRIEDIPITCDDGTKPATLKYFASGMGSAANTERHIKSCKIYRPTVSAMNINSTADTISVPTEITNSKVKLDEEGVLEYDVLTKELVVTKADVSAAKLLVAEYGTNNELKKVTPTDLTFTEGKATVANFTAPKGSKILVWNSLEEMEPLASAPTYDVDEPVEEAIADLTAILTSIEGFGMSSAVKWSIDTEDNTIELKENGAQGAQLVVKKGAPAGAVTVTATSGAAYAEKIINLTTTGNSITFEKQTASLTIPFSGQQDAAATYLAYTVDRDGNKTTHAVDDDGNELTDEATITYDILDKNGTALTAETMPTGVTFDAGTGVVTVTSQAKPTTIYVRAKNNDATPLSRTVKVNIHGLSFAFGTNAPTDDSYTQVTNEAYTDKLGYGFLDPSAVTAEASDVKGTKDYRFKIAVPNGNYAVQVSTTSASITSEVVESVTAVTGIAKTGPSFNVAVVDGVLDLTFANESTLTSVSVTQAEAKTKGAKPTLYAIGDSTTNSDNPGLSWGNWMASHKTDLPSQLGDFSNNGMAGRDSVNFYNQGRVETVLLNVRPGDYVTVNMGINSKEAGESAAFYTLLSEYYVEGIIQRGAIPVIVTATPQGPVNGHEGNYSNGTFNCNRGNDAHNGDLRDIAAKKNLHVIELGQYGDKYFNDIDEAFINAYNDANSTSFTGALPLVQSWYADHNHYKAYLGEVFAKYITDEVAKLIDAAAAGE